MICADCHKAENCLYENKYSTCPFEATVHQPVKTVNVIREIKDSGNRRVFNTGAVRDMAEGKGRYDLIPWEAIHELALHCERGAIKYGERNCEKGIPIHSLIDSAIRHLSCYMRGMQDEQHLSAALWNIAFAIWTEQKHPEMQDIPCRQAGD